MSEVPTVVKVAFDYCVFPLWGDFDLGQLSDDLRVRLQEWNDEIAIPDTRPGAERTAVDPGVHASWIRRGQALTAEVQTQLGDGYRVEFAERENLG